MVFRFLRENVFAAGALALLRLWVGWQWLDAGWGKLTGDKAFDASGFLNNAVSKPVVDRATNELIYPNFTSFIENFALPNVKLFNFAIPLGEFLIGLGLILGVLTTAAAFFGLLMNFMFMFAGTVSSNPWLILLGMIILVAGANAGKFGGDFYVLPFLRKILPYRSKDAQVVHHQD
ncbi:DoxX family protein [Paenibacillus sp. BR2-3]|uniref:DoxX family membrane protein n=1 Tax=Paenibacillus sp. BR2-3 TaxID=3048494 RepID=UPI0039774C5C